MEARVCVQTFINGDIQGLLYLDEGSGESLVTTSPVYAAGSAASEAFNIMGTKGNITARASVDVTNRTVDFSIDFTDAFGTSTSMYTRALAVSSAPC